MTESGGGTDNADGYEGEPEEDDQGKKFLDLLTGTLAGAVTGASGYAMAGPLGAVISNTATPFVAAVFKKLVGPFWEDQSRRVEDMLETATKAAELTREELADRGAESEESRLLTNEAIQAAANTIWPAGIRAIGRAYAAGLLAKNKTVLDIRRRVLGIMEGLDELHVSLLELLVKYECEARHDGFKAVPQRFPSYVNLYGGGDRPDNSLVWSVANRTWTVKQIVGVNPHLQEVLSSLLGELEQRGLIRQNDTAPAIAKQLGKDLAKQVNRQAEQMQRNSRTTAVTVDHIPVPRVEPSWSPTELGEKILGFYAEAGADDGQDRGQDPGESATS